MIDERDDAVREVGRLLAIDPSPEFALKVRTGLEALTHERSERRRPWTWGLLAVAAVSVVVIGLDHVRGGVASSPVAHAPDRVLPGARVSRTTPPMTVPAVRSAPLGQTAARRLSPSPVPAPMNSPDLSVLADQGAVIGQIWADAAARGSETGTVAKNVDTTAEDAALRPIGVSEIVSTPIVIAQIENPGDFGN